MLWSSPSRAAPAAGSVESGPVAMVNFAAVTNPVSGSMIRWPL